MRSLSDYRYWKFHNITAVVYVSGKTSALNAIFWDWVEKPLQEVRGDW